MASCGGDSLCYLSPELSRGKDKKMISKLSKVTNYPDNYKTDNRKKCPA